MSDSPCFLVLQHATCEPPGVYEESLRRFGCELTRVELDAGEALPSRSGFDGVIVMGGPMGVYDRDTHPWLNAELGLIADAVSDRQPVWGVCLGAQLLAGSLGARVFSGAQPEIGVLNVELTAAAADDPVFAGAPSAFATFQWHGDTYELPDGAVRLAGSGAYPQQAFRVGNAYGLQFHIEVSTELLGEWAQLPAYAAALASTHGSDALDQMLVDWQRAAPEANALAQRLFENWLTEIVGIRGPEATDA